MTIPSAFVLLSEDTKYGKAMRLPGHGRLHHRLQYADTLDESLMLQLILADDRAVRATYADG